MINHEPTQLEILEKEIERLQGGFMRAERLEAENAELKERIKAGNDCLDVELDKRRKLEAELERLAGAYEGQQLIINAADREQAKLKAELDGLLSENTAEWKSAAFQKVRRLLAENTKLRIENDGLKALGELYGQQIAELREWIRIKNEALKLLLREAYMDEAVAQTTNAFSEAKAALALGKNSTEIQETRK